MALTFIRLIYKDDRALTKSAGLEPVPALKLPSTRRRTLVFRSIRQLLGVLSAVALVAAVGCNTIHPNDPPPEESAKFELSMDGDARLVRLNRMTGDIVVIDGTHLIPLVEPEPPSTKDAARPISPPLKAMPQPPLAPPASDSGASAAPDQARAVDHPERQVVPGTTATTIIGAPVFLMADRTRTPLEIAPEGSVFRVIGEKGEWYHVEFDDPQWGRRVGFVEKKSVVPSSPGPGGNSR